MTKDVLISISGLHMSVNEVECEDDEPIEVLSPGTYYFKNGKHYVFFEEVVEGIPGVTKSQIKWKDEEVLEVRKKGITNMHLVFEKNKMNRCFYDTPYGQLNLGLFTTMMKVNETEEEIKIDAEYSMEVNFEPISESRIYIRVRPRDTKNFSII